MRRIRSVEAAAANSGHGAPTSAPNPVRNARQVAGVLLAAGLPVLFAGCSSSDKPAAPAPQAATPAPAGPDPASVKANEVGSVPILEFRDIGPGSGNTTVADFKKDLQWLYDHNYRPVGLTNFAKGKIDCPAGKMPVVITFDTGLPGQFNLDSSGSMDASSGIAILESFNRDHEDWPLVGSFLIDATSAKSKTEFGSTQGSSYKLERVVSDGFDLGCQLPANAGSMPEDKVRDLLAKSITELNSASMGTAVSVIGIPQGSFANDVTVLQGGTIQISQLAPLGGPAPGQRGEPDKKIKMTTVQHAETYTSKCAVVSGDKASLSSVAKKFDAYHIPRLLVSSARSVESAVKTIKDPFISDGDPATIAVPTAASANVDADKLTAGGVTLKTY